MSGQKDEIKRKAPYVSPGALSSFFDHIRYVSTPKRVDAGLLQDYGISKGNVFALLSAVKFLGLIDNKGTPTPAFTSLQTMGDQFRSNLREIVERAYVDLFARLDVSRDSRDHIRNYFARNYSASQADKATALFLDLCGEAGIPLAEQAMPARKAPGTTTAPRRIAQPTQRLKQEMPTLATEHEAAPSVAADDELRRLYITRLIGQISPPDTTGKDAAAINAEAELRRAELDRIERLLKISGVAAEEKESTEEELPF